MSNEELLNGTDRAVGFSDPSLAVNLSNIAGYSTELPFINVLKQAGDFFRSDGAWTVHTNTFDEEGNPVNFDYSEAAHAGFLDENGYIENLPEGANATVFLFNSIIAEAGTGGRYVFFYEGEGDFQVLGGTVVEDLSEPGRLVIDLDPATPIGLSINSVNPDDNLRDFSLVREEHVELYEAGAIFNPDFIELFDDHRTLRFLDWTEGNNSNQINFEDIASFDSAFWGIPSNQSYEYVFAYEIEELTAEQLSGLSREGFTPVYVDPQTGEPFRDPDTNEILIDVPPELLPTGVPTGVPLEVMVALANQVGADPWFNIPHQATDEFVRQFAEYVRDNLDPGLVAHFEYSNEVWNGQFEQFDYANERGLELFGDEYGEFPVHVYYGYRSAEVLDIVNDVFGVEAEARVHGVFATQTVNRGVTDFGLEGVARYLEDSGSTDTVATLFDSLSVTGYFGSLIPADPTGLVSLYRLWIEESKNLFASGVTSSVHEYFIQQVTTDLQDGALSRAYFQGLVDSGQLAELPVVLPTSVQELREHFAINKAIADENGLLLTQYEGGSHIVAEAFLNGDTELLEFLEALDGSPEIAGIYNDSLIAFRQSGGTLANDYGAVQPFTQFGPWGSLAHLNDQSLIFDTFEFYNENAAANFGSINAGRDFEAFTNGINETGTAGSDTLLGTRQEDFLSGSDGDDVLVGGDQNDGLNGGAGFDIALVSGTRSEYSIAVNGDGYTLTGPDGVDFLINIEAITFQDGESILIETFSGNASENVVYHGGQTFQAESNVVQDFVTIVAVDGSSVTGGELGILPGSIGEISENIYFAFYGDLSDQDRSLILSGVENATGLATLIGNASDIVGTVFGDVFEGFENDEQVDGQLGNDLLSGFGGNDTLSGGSGLDTILGGEGDDVLSGGFGNDLIDGGNGNDLLAFSGPRTSYVVSDNMDGTFTIIGNEGTDIVQNIELVSFTDGQSIIFEDWVAGVNNNVRYFGGGIYEVTNAGFTGVVISPVDGDTVTGDELGIILGEEIPATQVIYSIAARDNQFATYEAIHDNGAFSARSVVDLASNVGEFSGTQFDDIFIGSTVGEHVSFGAGDDRLSGFGGNDTLEGGSGADFLSGGLGDDVLVGGAGDDVLNGGDGADLVVLSGTEDQYTLSERQDGSFVISGIDGTDTLFGVERVQFSDGHAPTLDEWLNPSEPEVQVFGGGEFTVSGASEAGVIINSVDIGTQTANDLGVPVTGYENALDTVYFVANRDDSNATYDAIHNGLNGALSVVNIVTQIGEITGSVYNDVFVGAVGNENVNLGAGDDRLEGGDGNDTLFGGAGDDFVGGGNGDDLLAGGAGADVVNGGEGFDTLTFADQSGPVSLDFVTGNHGGDAQGDLLFGIEKIIATDSADTLILGDNAFSVDAGDGNDRVVGGVVGNIFEGGGGNDTLSGFGGTDSIAGGVGNDFLIGGDNNDSLFGQDGDDRLFGEAGTDFLEGGDGNDHLSGGADNDTLYGEAGRDRLIGNGGHDLIFGGEDNDVLLGAFNRDTLMGGNGNDVLRGGEGSDSLFGEDDNDLLSGGGGHDVLFGGEGNDILIGFGGFDTLIGGAGNDTLEGRFNADRFVFEDDFGVDTIRDFDALNNSEKIDLSAVTNITDFDDLVANHLIVDTDGVTQIVDGVNRIILEGVDINDLDAADFLFA